MRQRLKEDSMNAKSNTNFLPKVSNNKGFTLIEMAIVLVIIGIILGAVVKGQDLVTNAQAKQVTSAVNTWRNLAYAYLDRNGRLPGDSGRDGVIGNPAAELADTTSSIAEIVTTMQNAPVNPVIIGSMSFWLYFGNTAAAAATPGRNCLVVCKDAACAVAFTANELEIVKAVDTALDGVADGGLGQFRAVTTAPTLTALAAITGRTNSVATVVTAVDATAAGVSSTVTPANAWAAGVTKAAVWAFDRPF